jgi:DNA transformation protein
VALDPDYIRDLFASFGTVSIQRMFSGAGLYADGVIFALVSRGVIYLKTDETSVSLFEAEGVGPLTYDTKGGRRVLTSYWRLPDRLYDDPDELAEWARRALNVSRSKAASATRKPTRKAGKKPKSKARMKARRPGSAKRRSAKPRGRSRR